jgi:glycosyltransferase involved in cell wall biosynthesis
MLLGTSIDVLVDARVIERGHTGIARYVREITSELQPHMNVSAILTSSQAQLAGATEVVRARAPFLSQAEQVELPLRVAAWRGLSRRRGVFWVPSYNAACLAPGPMVVTIHDANHLAFPEEYSAAHALYYRTVVRLAARRAAAVITVSEFARRELIDRIGIAPEKIRVIANAITPRKQPGADAVLQAQLGRGLPERYVTYVGNFKPHKNLKTLLEAAPHFASHAPLVLIGGSEAELGNALPSARSRGAQVIVLRGVPDDELWPLLAGSSAFVFPSLYEGFGLPPLEAMGLGVPTIVSNTTSLPEVVGDAALQVNPRDADELGLAVRRVLDDAALAQSLGAAGRSRAASRTWREAALQTARVLMEAAET